MNNQFNNRNDNISVIQNISSYVVTNITAKALFKKNYCVVIGHSSSMWLTDRHHSDKMQQWTGGTHCNAQGQA